MTVVTGGLLADPQRGVVERGDLAVADGRISSAADLGSGESIDASGCLVMPGNTCAHHHLYSTLARGMPPPVLGPRNFPEILERIWWRLDRALDAETVHLSALAGALDAARAGTVAVVDHHASPSAIDGSLDAVAAGLDAVGLRGAVCYEVTDRGGDEGARAGVAENVRFLSRRRDPLVRGMMGAHASFTIGPGTLDALTGAARDLGTPVHIHLAEDACDERDSLERYGCRTAERLSNAGALGEGDLVAHGVHLDDTERRLLRTSGAWLAHNPRSNMNNCVGYARPFDLGERVALGTDGIDGDLWAEARACHLKAQESAGAGADFALERLGAGAGLVGELFGEPAYGTLETGAPADLVVLDYRPPTPVMAGNLAGHVLYGLGAAQVRDVMVAGRWIVRDRRHVLIDEAEVAARCREAAPRLWARMAEL